MRRWFLYPVLPLKYICPLFSSFSLELSSSTNASSYMNFGSQTDAPESVQLLFLNPLKFIYCTSSIITALLEIITVKIHPQPFQLKYVQSKIVFIFPYTITVKHSKMVNNYWVYTMSDSVLSMSNAFFFLHIISWLYNYSVWILSLCIMFSKFIHVIACKKFCF